MLRFYGGLVEIQEPLFFHPGLSRWIEGGGSVGLEALPVDAFHEELELFLEDFRRIGTGAMAGFIEGLGPGEAVRLVERFRDGPASPRAGSDRDGGSGALGEFVARSFLEPFAVRVAVDARSGDDAGSDGPGGGSAAGGHVCKTCPVCGRPPLLAVLSDRADRKGGRDLQCSLCATRWSHPRLTCAACGETSPDRLAQRLAEGWPQLRLDVCLTCESYMKTVDLRRDGTAVPAVDDLASLALDVWARGQGWTRAGRGHWAAGG